MLRLALALVAAVLAFPVASAATFTFDVQMTDDGFRVSGEDGLDPTLFVEPGSHVEVAVRNVGSTPQNFHVGAPIDRATPFAQRPGQSATLAFDVPKDLAGDVSYVSDADPAKLAGVIRVGPVPPVVRIVSPAADGAVVGLNVTIDITVKRFVLDPFAFNTTNVEGRGHVVYALDGKNASGPSDRTTIMLPDVSPGTHVVRAFLVQHDGTPVQPAAFADRLVSVHPPPTPSPTSPSPASPTPSSSPANPTPGAAPLPSVALALVLALALLSASRSRRPR